MVAGTVADAVAVARTASPAVALGSMVERRKATKTLLCYALQMDWLEIEQEAKLRQWDYLEASARQGFVHLVEAWTVGMGL